MHRKHRIFFLLGLLLVFALLFLYLIYDQKYNVFYPKPPVISYIIPASDSTSFPGVYQYDLENVNNNNIVTKEYAFSGKNALKVSGKRNYSPAIQIPFDEQLQKTTEARFGAWLFFDDSTEDLEGKLEFQIVDRTNKLKFSAASDIKERKSNNRQWFYVCGKAVWKNCKVLPEDLVKIYYWNNCRNTVYVDNIQVVFGSQIIKGEKSLTDNTSHQFQFIPVKNQPPYPSIFYKNEFANNVKNTTVFLPDGKDSLVLVAEDVFCKGRFIRSNNNCEQILVFRNKKPLALLWFDQLKSQFLFIKLPSEVIANFPELNIFSAIDVDGDGTEELVACSENKVQSLNVYKIQVQKPYVKSMLLVKVKQLDISAEIIQIEPFCPANKINKNIVLLDDIGNLHLLHYEKNSMRSETTKMISEADMKNYKCKMVCGHFLNSGASDNLILFYSEKKSGRCFYKIYGLENKFQHFEALVQGAFDNKCDTLDPDNSFFKCDINNDKIDELLSFSNGWRFDAKLITFNKEGYVIGSNIDFTGYPKDHNPKYFEKLTMTAGNFIDKNTPAIVTFCGSANKEKVSFDDMTSYLGIFSYKNKN